MKFVLGILCLCVFLSSADAAEYKAMKLFDMAISADRIAYGTIVKVEEMYFYLAEQNNRGNKIKIAKYIGLAGSGSYRFAKYEEGQKVLVFLRRKASAFELISTGAEGEVPVIRDSLVIDMQCFSPATVLNMSPRRKLTDTFRNSCTHLVGVKKVFGLKFSVSYFYTALQNFRNCYQIILKKEGAYASYNCFNFFDRYTRDKLNVQKKKSKLLKLMYDDMETVQLINCRQQ